jgi:hypothetical protein
VLHEPWPDFMVFYGTLATAASWITPKSYFEKVGPDGFKKHLIGLGPYKFVSQRPGKGSAETSECRNCGLIDDARWNCGNSGPTSRGRHNGRAHWL